MPELTKNEQCFIFLLRAALSNRTFDNAFSDDVDIASILHLAANHKLYHMILAAMPTELLTESQNRRPALLNQVTAQVNVTSAFLRL